MTIFCLGHNHPSLRPSPAAGADPAEDDALLVASKADGALSGPWDPIPLLPVHRQVDWEAELVLRIGSPAFQLPDPAQAQAVISHWGVGNDITDRWWQSLGGGQWMKGKSFPGFAPHALAETPPDFDLERRVRCWLNGELVQDAWLHDYVHPPAAAVQQLSGFTRLLPGDLVFCGSFPGMGFQRQPPRFLADGDLLETEIEGLGRLENPVRALRSGS
ncbi:MAG: fumarylacetoacetate hydrolase family protein [Synechococcus sp.]